MRRARARLGATALGLGGVVFAVIQLLERTVGAFNPRPVTSVLVAVTVGAAGVTLERARHLASTQRFLRGVLKDWPLRTAAATDPLALGVFPPVRRARSEGIGPYVPRTADECVDRALRAGGLVLVVGPERAGKSRTAYEALLRILPGSPVLVPLDGSGLSALTTEASFDPAPETVWWLDDLERFLPHLGGAELAALLDGGRTVVATIREAAWRSLLHAGGEDGERGRRLLAAAHVIHLPTALDQREAAAAAELYPGTDLSRGIGEALGAGDDASPWVPRPADAGEEGRRRRVDPVLGLALAATATLALALGGVGLTGGFLTRTPPAIGVQVDAIRKQAEQAGRPVVQTLNASLHGFDQRSYVFVMRSPTGGSDALRIYDDVHGWLRRRLEFRPNTRSLIAGYSIPDPKPQQRKGIGVDYSLETPVVVDVNSDGDAEIIADYALRSYLGVRLPIVVGWNDAAQRYELFPLLVDALPPRIGRGAAFHQPGFFHGLFALDDLDNHKRIAVRAVSSFVVLPAAANVPALLATATEVTRRPAGKPAVAISVYKLSLTRGRPETILVCTIQPGHTGVVLARAARTDDADYRALLRRLAPGIARRSHGAAPDPTGQACTA